MKPLARHDSAIDLDELPVVYDSGLAAVREMP